MVAIKPSDLAFSIIKDGHSSSIVHFTSQSGLLCGFAALFEVSLIQSSWVLSRLPGNIEVTQSLNLVC